MNWLNKLSTKRKLGWAVLAGLTAMSLGILWWLMVQTTSWQWSLVWMAAILLIGGAATKAVEWVILD